MSLYRKTFPKPRTLLPVIHAEEEEQVLRNVGICHEGGADGCWLINHSIRPWILAEFHAAARKEFPGFWIGVNVLDVEPAVSRELIPDADGLWVDDAGIRNSGNCTEAAQFSRRHLSGDRTWLYFGGVAFKGQESINDPALAAWNAMQYMDVVTTSGPGTGLPPDVNKIREMKTILGEHPLANASGITPENVHPYLPYIDCYLIATGISDSDTELNLARVRMMVDVLR